MSEPFESNLRWLRGRGFALEMWCVSEVPVAGSGGRRWRAQGYHSQSNSAATAISIHYTPHSDTLLLDCREWSCFARFQLVFTSFQGRTGLLYLCALHICIGTNNCFIPNGFYPIRPGACIKSARQMLISSPTCTTTFSVWVFQVVLLHISCTQEYTSFQLWVFDKL